VDKEIARAVVDDDEKLNDIFDEIDSKAEVGEFTQDEVQQETVAEEEI
jgi:tetrahydromethanopterin S-methyltransferase subunit G